ncbi:secretoglobin family 1D member 2 [Papio anubis]|uniref:secretoglobin family 1D member 2 n=1 Tax=Papio anubis TaxID=9555 RepID=UPI00027F5262|nr:secretoglobin family 1D member 2 [Papio anubis]
MRLSVCLLLVSLALSCYQANAAVCPAVVSELFDFLFISERVFKLYLARYDAPPEFVAAKLRVKRCTDQTALQTRSLIAETLVKILKKCSM